MNQTQTRAKVALVGFNPDSKDLVRLLESLGPDVDADTAWNGEDSVDFAIINDSDGVEQAFSLCGETKSVAYTSDISQVNEAAWRKNGVTSYLRRPASKQSVSSLMRRLSPHSGIHAAASEKRDISASTHPFCPFVLLTTEDVENSLGGDQVIVEVDHDPVAYEQGHVPGAILWNWEQHLRNPSTKEVISVDDFETLMSYSGISNDTRIVLYGDNNNWFACWAFWVLRMYGHENVFLMDGGSKKWLAEQRPLSLEPAIVFPANYKVEGVDKSIQATTEEVFEACMMPDDHRLVDVRSRAEYRGELTGPGAGAGSTCEVGGHIPTAVNIPWDENCNPDGSFLSPETLARIYNDAGVTPDKKVVTYCAIGERASLSWFVLKELLGYGIAMSYDRSMSYWSSLVGAPIVEGEAA